ncbi:MULTISPECIES: thioredoxin family protein [unclassified Carboxylicivirga]|uniref:thioredoxin family protein n=1 Tax=Carboxylicivirga TaxID=1628153 RepID=UPI003D337CEB
MKKLYSTILLVLTVVSVVAQGINFENSSLSDALAKAKAENKLLFIDGYAVWCGPCKHMAKTVFMEEEVGKYFDAHLVALKVDVERGEGPTIKRKYNIKGLPGYVFLDGDGNVVYRFSASMPTDRFMKEVKLAVKYSKDSLSLGRLAERYNTEKNDEAFLKTYLAKLKESNSTNYTDVLEQYLSIQKNIDESSREMVLLLADHYEEIIFGGRADEIIQRNFGSDAWKQYVRKDIREAFQKLPKSMIEKTTDYAVAKKDTAILEMTMRRAEKAGVKVDDKQRKRAYTYFYEKAGMGKQYKALVRQDNEAFIQSIDVEQMRNAYLDLMKRKAEGDAIALASRPHSERISHQISAMVNSYAKFACTEQEKKDVKRWMKVAYQIIPGNAAITSQYATILYKLDENKEEAIKLMEEAYQHASQKDDKRSQGIKKDLELMKAGESIVLK